MNDLIQTLARELDAAPEHVENVVRLIDESAYAQQLAAD